MFVVQPNPRDDDPESPVPQQSSWQAIMFSRRMIYLAGMVLLLASLSALRPPQFPDLVVGERAPETIVVPKPLEFTDVEATEESRRQAGEMALQVYLVDHTGAPELKLRAGLVRELARLIASDTGAPEIHAQLRHLAVSPAAQARVLADAEGIGRRLLLRGVVATAREAEVLAQARRVRWVRRTAAGETSDSHAAAPVEARDNPVDSFVAYARVARAEAPLVCGALLAAALPANVTRDDAASLVLHQQAVQEVPPVLINVPAGRVLIQKGERLKPEEARILVELGRQQAEFDGLAVVGYLGFFAGSLMAFMIFLYKFFPQNYGEPKSLLLLALLYLLPLLILKLLQLFTTLPGNIVYLMPVPAVSALVALLFHPRLAVYFNVFIALATALYAGSGLVPFLVHWGAGIVAIFAVARIQRRSHIVRAGLWVGGAMVTMFIIGTFLTVEPGENRVLIQALGYALLNGLFITPVAIIGLLVFFEDLFDRTTNFRLLELADLGNELLREMLLKASGSYQHALTVGMLAENAAEEIGARPLLARVGAYYHDIGKLERPEYFAENQNYMEQSKHGNLKPSLSAAILKAHVKEGVERGRAWRLPAAIIDIIRQHHGTSVMQYFYCQALETESDGAVNRDDYQYPGPKPQTREAAIVMMADSVEAATRTMKNPTPLNIEELVKKVVTGKFVEGELEECDLTLRDLHRIVACFTRLLTSMYHTRIEYPDEAKLRALEKAQKETREERDNAPGAPDPAPGA